MNGIVKEKEDKRIKMNHEQLLHSIEVDKILHEYGNFTQLLPDELKKYGKDKIYS